MLLKLLSSSSSSHTYIVLPCKQQTVVEVATDQQIVEEVTATETITSEVMAGDQTMLTTDAVGATPVTLVRTKRGEHC